MKNLKYILAIVVLLSVKRNIHAQTALPEYRVKAAFLFNFTQFIEWPPTAFASTQSPFIIGVLGEDPFKAYLNETVSGETVKGHPILIQHYKDTTEIKTCHVLFINISQASKLESALKNPKIKAALTVGDASSFIQKGGAIKFYEEDDRIKLEINPGAAQRAGLIISSRLLKLAKITTIN